MASDLQEILDELNRKAAMQLCRVSSRKRPIDGEYQRARMEYTAEEGSYAAAVKRKGLPTALLREGSPNALYV